MSACGGSTERGTLSTREPNRALLARQLLLERSELPLARPLERVAGLQTPYTPCVYIGLWSRLCDFRRDALQNTPAAFHGRADLREQLTEELRRALRGGGMA